MDAWERLVAEGKDRLSATEGAPVSWREIVRRAGYTDGDFGRVAYHLLPRVRRGGKHYVPEWLIDALAPVLPFPRRDLEAAAAEAAGYAITTHTTTPPGRSADAVLAPLLDVLMDERRSVEERERLGLEVIGAVTRALQRIRT